MARFRDSLKRENLSLKMLYCPIANCFLKGRLSTKYLELYKTLFKDFLQPRSNGHITNFSWLWSKARKLQLDIDPKVEVKYHVTFNDSPLFTKERVKNEIETKD